MIVSYHRYNLSNELFVDGANYYYIENTRLLEKENPKQMELKPHDFRNLILGKENLSCLRKADALLSNVGPYAHVYHYLREKLGLNFRIIRDVQTGPWQGYLLQEKICSKYMREGDKVMFLSEFARQLYMKLFSETLNEDNTFVCAPFMYFFPKTVEKKESSDEFLKLGWVGRVTREKNFHQALDAFIQLYKENKDTKFIVAGESTNRMKIRIKKKLKKNKVKKSSFVYINDGHFIPHETVWDVYRMINVFLFPSLSINESLGRTMIEACYMDVPIVAANYGASPEILEKKNLVSAKYKDGLLQLDSTNPYSFGEVNFEEFIEKIRNYQLLSKKNKIQKYSYHYKKFFNILQGYAPNENLRKLDKEVKEFIGRIHLYNDGLNLSVKDIINRTKEFILKTTDTRHLSRNDQHRRRQYCTKVFFSKEDYYILNKYHFFIPYALKYNPYLSVNENSMRIRLEKLLVHLKKPVKQYFKKRTYSKLQKKYLKYPCSKFDYDD